MAAVAYSTDGGTTWVTPVGDTWPVTTGLHLVRLEFKNAVYARRVIIRITSTDGDVWSVRFIVLKGERKPQEMSGISGV